MINKQFHSQVYKKDLVYEKKSRYIKTKKIISILRDTSLTPLKELKLLDVGCASGLISLYLSRYFKKVTGADVDKEAIKEAKKLKNKKLFFKLLNLDGSFPFDKNSFDVVVANQIYEHAKNPKLLMKEIHRVLKPDGTCFLGAGNRLIIRDAHYPNLPFVSWLPTWLANYYVRITKSGDYYEPRLKTSFGIRKMIRNFSIDDYTLKVIKNPERFNSTDVIKRGSLITKLPGFVLRLIYPIIPNYLLILRKKKSS